MRIDIGKWQLRDLRPEDAQSIAEYANNWNVSRHLSDRFPYPYRVADAEEFIRHAAGSGAETIFAIASATEVIGGIGLELYDGVHRRSAQVGYWLGEPFWGRGIATLALRAVTDYAFTQFDLARLYAYVYEWNPASARVLEKVGYECEGRLRKSITKDAQTIDQMLYAIVRE